MSGSLLQQCEKQELFLITGECDVEASISAASVKSVSSSGGAALATLSSGGTLQLRRIGGRWLVVDERAGAHPSKLGSGPCAGA